MSRPIIDISSACGHYQSAACLFVQCPTMMFFVLFSRLRVLESPMPPLITAYARSHSEPVSQWRVTLVKQSPQRNITGITKSFPSCKYILPFEQFSSCISLHIIVRNL